MVRWDPSSVDLLADSLKALRPAIGADEVALTKDEEFLTADRPPQPAQGMSRGADAD